MTLKEHPLYATCRDHPFFQMLEPPFETQMKMGQQLAERYPELGQDPNGPTEIFINVVTIEQRSVLHQITDDDRLNKNATVFKDFIAFQRNKIYPETDAGTPTDEEQLRIDHEIALLTLQSAIGIFLEGDDAAVTEKILAMLTIKSWISLIYNDPIAVLINVQQSEVSDGSHRYPITMAWRLISRTPQ